MSDPARHGMTYQPVVIIGRPAGLLGDPLGTLMSQPTERRSANFSIYSFNYGEVRDMPTIGRY